jgi:hypothetical protein
MKNSNLIEVLTKELSELETRRNTLQTATSEAEAKLKSAHAGIDLGDTSRLPEVAVLRSQASALRESLERLAVKIAEKQAEFAAAQQAARREVLWARVLEMDAASAASGQDFNREMLNLKEEFARISQMFFEHQDAAERERVETMNIRHTLGLDERAFIAEQRRRMAAAGLTIEKREDFGALFPAFNNVLQQEERRRRAA